MRELFELLEHDARRLADELASMLHRSEYEVHIAHGKQVTEWKELLLVCLKQILVIS